MEDRRTWRSSQCSSESKSWMRRRRCCQTGRQFDALCLRPCSRSVTQTLSHHFSCATDSTAWRVHFIAFCATIHATRSIFHVYLPNCCFIYFRSEKLLKVALHLFIHPKKKWNMKCSTFCSGFIVSEANPEAISMCICRQHVTHCSPFLRNTFQVHRFASILRAMPTQFVPNVKHLK